MKKTLIVLLITFTSIIACRRLNSNDPPNSAGVADNAISVSGTVFIDSFGRQVILSGFNYVNKNPDENYIYNDSSEIYRQMSGWGINCLRLGIIWDGIEPQPGQYDEKYLEEIERKISLAADNNIYVLLDMHQDLYSGKFKSGDGAPEWATIDEKQPHNDGEIWSDAYLISKAIQTSFDNFWANKPASDGLGIQDHYINMWKHVAGRFSKYNNILGYDLMNEPFNGSDANQILPLIISEYARIVADETGQGPPSEEELMLTFGNEESRTEALNKLSKSGNYARMIDAAYNANRQFESTRLQDFYQKAADHIRQVDTTHIIFLEHGYFSNTGIITAIKPVKSKSGHTDPLQAYAAHGYDLVTDTKNVENQSNERVELIFNRIDETSRRLNLPVLIGEWGAFYGEGAGSIPAARSIITIFERFMFGNTYWAFSTDIGNKPCFIKALNRAYPQFIAGKLQSYSFKWETGEFDCKWEENSSLKAPTVIYIPDMKNLISESIILTPENTNTIIKRLENSNGGYLIIPVNDKGGERKIEFKIKTDPYSIQ